MNRLLITVVFIGVATPVMAQPTPEPGEVGRAEFLGDSLMAAFQTSRAIDAYRVGLRLAPKEARLLNKTAYALSNLAEESPGLEGDEAIYQEAVDLARRAVELDPETSWHHSTLAAVLGRHALFQGGRRKVELGREIHAEATRAVELDPLDYRPFIVLGVWHREVATLNPVMRGIARAFLGGLPRGSLETSRIALERARRLAPDIVFTHVELALTYLELDHVEDARRSLEAALRLTPVQQLDRVYHETARKLLEEI